MKFRVIFFKILTVSLLLVFVACSQKSGGDAEFAIDGTSETGSTEDTGSKVSLTGGVTENMSEQARIENYAKVAKLNPEVTWKQWQEYKGNLDASIELNLVSFTYNAANLAAMAKFFIATDNNVGFTFNAIFQKPVGLFIIAQYTYYTFKTAAQQQANTVNQLEGEQAAEFKEDGSSRRGIRGASTKFQGAIETFSNALAIFNRLLIADYQSVGLDVAGIDITASGSREFATFNVKQLDATAIENKLAGTDYTFATFLNQQLEFVFSSSVVVASGIEYTFVAFNESEYTFSTEFSAEMEFAPREAFTFSKELKAEAGSLEQRKSAVGIEAQAQIEQQHEAQYQAIEKEGAVIKIENQVKVNAVSNQEAQLLLDSTSNTLSFSKEQNQTVEMNQDSGDKSNQILMNNQDSRKSIFREDANKVIKAYNYEQEIHGEDVDSEERSDDID